MFSYEWLRSSNFSSLGFNWSIRYTDKEVDDEPMKVPVAMVVEIFLFRRILELTFNWSGEEDEV